jgi:hypothetical protein
MANKDNIQSSYRIPKELHKMARIKSLELGKSFNEVLEELVQMWIKGEIVLEQEKENKDD